MFHVKKNRCAHNPGVVRRGCAPKVVREGCARGLCARVVHGSVCAQASAHVSTPRAAATNCICYRRASNPEF